MLISFSSSISQWLVPLEKLALCTPRLSHTLCPITLGNVSSVQVLRELCTWNSGLYGKAQPWPEQRQGHPHVALAASSFSEMNRFSEMISKGCADYACDGLESRPLRFNLSSNSFVVTEHLLNFLSLLTVPEAIILAWVSFPLRTIWSR